MEEGITKWVDLTTLKQRYKNCRQCREMCVSRTSIGHGWGNKSAPIMFIGEAPNEAEDKQGIPFAGPPGRMLGQMLYDIGLEREDVWTTNTVMCRPAIKNRHDLWENRTPTKSEINACLSRLQLEICNVDPDLVVLMGEVPARTLLGQSAKMSKLVGQWFTLRIPVLGTVAEYPTIVLWHPSYLLRVDAGWDDNGPAKQTLDYIRHAVKCVDLLHILRESPKRGLSYKPDLPHRGEDASVLGKL